MKNVMVIGGYRAVVSHDPEIEMFRGEFVGLNGGADFYARDVEGLRHEGEISLRVFLEACEEDGVDPRKPFSGKFLLRVNPAIHEEVALVAAAQGKSINQWVSDVLGAATEATGRA